MGRSSGKNKRLNQTIKTRASAGKELTLPGFENMPRGKDPLPGVTETTQPEYVPEEDHQQLIDDAFEHWSFNSEYLLDPETALKRYKETHSDRERHPEKFELSYWEKAMRAVLWQAAHGTMSPQTVYRGQAVDHSHPFDRARSWTTEPGQTAQFASSKYYIDMGDNPRTVRSRAGILLQPGEVVFVRVYVIDKATRGLNVNEFLEDYRKDVLVQRLESGEKGVKMISKKDTGEYKKETVSLEDAKWDVIVAAKNALGYEKTNDIVIDHEYGNRLVGRIPQGIPIENIERLLTEIDDRGLEKEWFQAKKEVFQKIRSSKYAQSAANEFAPEEEVIVSPAEEDRVRYINVPVAFNTKEARALNRKKLAAKIEEAVEKFQGHSATESNSGQGVLFHEGVNIGPKLNS